MIILAKFLKNILQLLTGLDYNLIFAMLLKQYLDSKLQKLQDFKIILAAIHLLFKIVINLTLLENSQAYVYSEVYVYKTVRCQVINVEFLNRDLPLNNSAIMVK